MSNVKIIFHGQSYNNYTPVVLASIPCEWKMEKQHLPAG